MPGPHQHTTRPLREILQEISELIEIHKDKYGALDMDDQGEDNLNRLFLIAKDFRQIGESALNISDYIMDLIGGSAGIKGLEGVMWDVISAKTEKDLRGSMLKLRKHIKSTREGRLRIREYTTPNNLVDKVNQKKLAIQVK